MLELEFLPAWYPKMRRRRRRVMLQAWATLMLIAGLGLWVFLADQNITRRQVDASIVHRELLQSRLNLREYEKQLKEKQQLEVQKAIMDKVGVHIEVTRLVAKLDQIMPKEMTLTEAVFDTTEQPKSSGDRPGDKTPEMNRTVSVHLKGVTPSDADWAGVLAKLSNVAFFQNVRLIGAIDKIDAGHRMREFEVTFAVDLGEGG